jgi:hypothetical protein
MYNDDNPYSDDDGSMEPKPGESDNFDKDHEGGETTVAPKSIFQGKIPSPGDMCKFRVESVGEDDVELSWVDDKEDKENKGDEHEDMGGGPKDENSLASMME